MTVNKCYYFKARDFETCEVFVNDSHLVCLSLELQQLVLRFTINEAKDLIQALELALKENCNE